MAKIRRYSKLKSECNLPKGYEIIDGCHKNLFEFSITQKEGENKDWRGFIPQLIHPTLIIVEKDELNRVIKNESQSRKDS